MISLSVAKLKMFSLESEIFGSMPTFRSTRKSKKCFFVMSLHLSDHKLLHNIASSSSIFQFHLDFLAFFTHISDFKFLVLEEFNKTIIPFALVGRLVIANLALRASLAIYHLISNARSWNNC